MNTKSIGLLASLVFAVGFIGTSFGGNAFTSEQPTASTESASIYGHIEAIVTDANGNIKAYQQTDNLVMNQGKNCAARSLFGTAALSSPTLCGTATTGMTAGNFTVVGLSPNALSGLVTTNTELPQEFLLSGGKCAGICRSTGTGNTTGTVTSVQDAVTDGQAKIVKIAKTFTLTNASATIRSAGLFNSTNPSTDAVFAMRAFSTAVSMVQNDQLTVNWQITLN